MTTVRRAIKHKVGQFTPAQVRAREATSNDAMRPPKVLLEDLVYDVQDQFRQAEVFQILWKRLGDDGKNWRHVLKSLLVVEHLIQHGPPSVMDLVSSQLYVITTLKNFQHVEKDGTDQGALVRKKAEAVAALVRNSSKPQQDDTPSPGRASNSGASGDIAIQTGVRSPSLTALSGQSQCSSPSRYEIPIPKTQHEEAAHLGEALKQSEQMAQQEVELRQQDALHLQIAKKMSLQESVTDPWGVAKSASTPPSTDPWGVPVTQFDGNFCPSPQVRKSSSNFCPSPLLRESSLADISGSPPSTVFNCPPPLLRDSSAADISGSPPSTVFNCSSPQLKTSSAADISGSPPSTVLKSHVKPVKYLPLPGQAGPADTICSIAPDSIRARRLRTVVHQLSNLLQAALLARGLVGKKVQASFLEGKASGVVDMDNLLNENFKPRSPLKGGPPGASLNQIRMSQIEANVPQVALVDPLIPLAQTQQGPQVMPGMTWSAAGLVHPAHPTQMAGNFGGQPMWPGNVALNFHPT